MSKKYRKLSEFQRLLKEIRQIKIERNFRIVEKRIEDAYTNEKLNYVEYQSLLKKLSDKADEIELFKRVMGDER